MAFIPDEAIDAMTSVSNGAFQLYVYYCRRRNGKDGTCFPSSREAAQALGSPQGHNRVLGWRKELANRGWIRVEGQVIVPIFGFTSKDKLPGKIKPAPPAPSGDIASPLPRRKHRKKAGDMASPETPQTGDLRSPPAGDIASPPEHAEKSAPGDILGAPLVTFRRAPGDISVCAYKEEPAINQQIEPAIDPPRGVEDDPRGETETTGLHESQKKPRKKGTRKAGKSALAEAWTEPWYTIFTDAYELLYQCPYKSTVADFSNLAALLKTKGKASGQPWLTVDRFVQAVKNYFSSDLGNHTLAHLAGGQFGAFYRSPLDRYNKPTMRPESVNGALTRRESDNERKLRETRESIAADYRAAGNPQAAAAILAGDPWPPGDGGLGVEPRRALLGEGTTRHPDE